MREQVAQAVTLGVVSPPSEEQWAMILCRQPLARIFAGAGSGKSTTLVLRVVFMLCHLGVEPQRLTVISFTNASCAQLREQLLRLLAHWQYPFDAAQARQCVRTFHSALGSLAREVLGNPRWFEQLDDRDPPPSRTTPCRRTPASGSAAPAEAGLPAVLRGKPGVPRQDPQAAGTAAAGGAEEGARRQPKAPLEPFKLAGEFQALPLYEAFHAQAGFAESLGLRVERLDSGKLECGLREKIFVEAMALFWARFQALLREEGLMTFDAAFQQLGERMAGGALAETALAPFTHLLIDEFRDVSPQIVLWLQALHRRLATQGTAPSLMAIGDDWQSIYGWRGSSPELFIDFDRHFPSRGRGRKSALLVLETNYRSVEPIIRDGEKVLAGVRFKQDKTCRAFRPIQPGDHGVKLVQRFDLRAQLPKLLAEIRAQCEHAAARESSERTAVLLLSRRNEPLQAIQAELDRALPVKGMTIHRAKGLQAEVAIVVDDCLPGEKHPLRNALYAASGFFRNSYDQAMEDESLRLAYVAITRGVSRVLWYTRKAQGATALLARR
ncbi:UvrD-helicase domain-containing protein [Pseudomonas aeruginosa]|nr:UvrD-helicase domain-containing protein [Pseudomonas aeruginosa]